MTMSMTVMALNVNMKFACRWLFVLIMALELIRPTEAASEQTALIVLSLAVAIPALFLLTCCCTLVFICHYRHKIPIFKSFSLNARKGAGTSSSHGAPTSTFPAPAPYAPSPAPQPGAPSPPSTGPGQENPVEVDDVVVPIQKD